MTRAVGIAEAARAIGERERTVRAWIERGAPVAKRGGRGRGRSTLVDPDALLEWRGRPKPDQRLLEFASDLPRLIADATVDAYQRIPDEKDKNDDAKKLAAGVLAACWALTTCVLLNRLRAYVGDDREVQPDDLDVPPEIANLRAIFESSGKLRANTIEDR